MIRDQDTNFVYFSNILRTDPRFKRICDQITQFLDLYKVPYDFLPNTKDIWARDYMPIQVSENKFVEYRYDPDYLQAKKYRKIKTYPDLVCDSLNLKTIKTDIILDGGNVIKSSDSVILTKKVFEENKEFYNRTDLHRKLKQLFEVENIIPVPWDKKHDYFGHSDGMIRFINNDKVVLQGYFDTFPLKFQDELFGNQRPLVLNMKD